ncbi:ADP-ribosylglycohydrolase family protein [Nocardioides sp. DS6]|uniref:ADP-ribosylglycohydrolase family protein n=1 Tax=Nocardioides eburneus TaxID=3231482 RepID=A0ABV3T2P0_9ACTN
MTTRRRTDLHDRAAGVLLGQACGDALGVPYEFGTPPAADEPARMTGGGLGDFAPGEWSDDTAMAVAVAEGLLAGATFAERLDAIASGFLTWFLDGPADIGVQTRHVLAATARRTEPGAPGVAHVMTEEAEGYAARHPHSAGNGALMRTSPVALAYLHDPAGCAQAARAVAALTHADPLAVDSCVVWSESIRRVVGGGRLELAWDVLAPDRSDIWAEFETLPLRPNGFTVAALRAAWHAITTTPVPEDPALRGGHLVEALHAAVRLGDDTDTVAAIAGGLLGARWGAASVPPGWRRAVHGWPGRTADDLDEIVAMLVDR